MHTSTAKLRYISKPEPCSQGLRKCHERGCNRMTPDYRRPSCQKKHLARHRANMEGFTSDETYRVLH